MERQKNNIVPILEFKQVSLVAPFGLDYLLQDISFKIFFGDRVAIVGVSGSGKTSLLKLINRLIDPSSGKIFFQGNLINKGSVIELRRKIVLVPQEPKLLGMKVNDTLVYPLQLQQLSPSEIRQRIDTQKEALRIPDLWLDKTELELSLGQRQLVTIARGLVMQPEILLLDEPTSALDIGTSDRVLNVLMADKSKTILMVNHDLELSKKFASRILYLDSGRLLKDTISQSNNWEIIKEKIIRSKVIEDREWGDI